MRWLVLISALLLAACGGKREAERTNTLHYVNMDEPKRLDPAFVKDLYEGIVSGLIYEGLVIFGQGTDIQPGLAQRWEISPDGRIYTFHLRDAKFANGKPVTSADVRYSFARVLRPATNSDRKWVLNRIEGADEVVSGTATQLRGVATPDPRTVQITLNQPYPVFLTMLAMPTAVIIPENSAGADSPDTAFNEKPIGSGPWVLERWLHDRRLEFRANKNHWAGATQIEQFIYHIQADESVRRQQFETGNVDIYQVGFNVFASWMDDPKKRALMKPVQELRTDYIGFMNHKPKLSDVRVRQAVTHAIDSSSIFKNLQKERGVFAGGPVPAGIPGYRNAHAKVRERDVASARKLLSDAGVQRMELSFWYRDEALSSEIVRVVKSSLAEVGIEVVPTPRDQAALRAGIWRGQPDLFLGSWTLDYPDMENAIVPPFHSRNIPRQGNGSHFSNPEVDQLLDTAQAETDPAKRLTAYQAAEDEIIRQCPWVFLFHRAVYYAVQPRVKGWTPAVMYNADRFTSASLSE